MGRSFPESKIHKSRSQLILVPPEESQAVFIVRLVLLLSGKGGGWSQGSMSMLSRVSWLRWGELGLGGLELLEGVECLVESESGWVRDNEGGVN